MEGPGCFNQVQWSLIGVVGYGHAQIVKGISGRFQNADDYVFSAQFGAGGDTSKSADNGKSGAFFDHKGRAQHPFPGDGRQQVVDIRSGCDAIGVVACIDVAQRH